MSKQEKSDLSVDKLLGSEGSGIEKFDHTKEDVYEALNVSKEDWKRIKDVLNDLKPPQSLAVETILLSDKLHTTKERLIAVYEVASKLTEFRIMSTLMGKMLGGGMGGTEDKGF